MKKILFLAAVAISIFLVSNGEDLWARATKPKQAASKPELIDYPGYSLGRDVPDWVLAVSDGDKAGVRSALDISNDTMLFVVSKQGNNLDFLRTWVDQIDARVEVASSLETVISNTVQNTLAANSADSETVRRAAKLYGAQATTMTLNGLSKVAEYWIKTRTQKIGVRKPKSEADYTFSATYFVVFCMDKSIYQEQLDAAMKDAEDNNDPAQNELLRNVLTARCSDALMSDDVKGSMEFEE